MCDMKEFRYKEIKVKKAKYVKSIEIVWNIFSYLELGKTTFCTNTANYSNNLDDDLKFQLMVQNECDDDDVYFYYRAPRHVLLKCELNIDRVVLSRSYNRASPNKWQLLYVMPKQDSYLEIDEGGEVILRFLFTVFKKKPVADYDEATPKSRLQRDLEGLLRNSTFADVTLKSVEGVNLPAHKAVLSARSPVLKAHFEYATEETADVVKAPFKIDVLREALNYIYTDNAPPNLDAMPQDLLVVADYYQLDGLKGLCEKVLHEMLSIENAIETLELADLHCAENLKDLTLKYIVNGPTAAIMKTERWEKMQSINLVKIILEYKFKSDE